MTVHDSPAESPVPNVPSHADMLLESVPICFPPVIIRRFVMDRQELLDQRAVILAGWAAVTSHGVAYPVSSIGNAHDMLRHCPSLASPTFGEYTVGFARKRRGSIDAPEPSCGACGAKLRLSRQSTDLWWI